MRLPRVLRTLAMTLGSAAFLICQIIISLQIAIGRYLNLRYLPINSVMLQEKPRLPDGSYTMSLPVPAAIQSPSYTYLQCSS